MMNSEQLVCAWLKDAYAMESTLVNNLSNHAKDAQDHPEVEARIREHMNQTQRHADMIRQCLERHGEKVSTTKTALGKLTGIFGNLHAATDDEILKNCLMDVAAEHFEIACYKSLVTAARAMGDHQTAQVCEEILHEEQAMADWLEQNIPALTTEQLAMAH
jgi:ferritin-like metal-binding protein YciE